MIEDHLRVASWLLAGRYGRWRKGSAGSEFSAGQLGLPDEAPRLAVVFCYWKSFVRRTCLLNLFPGLRHGILIAACAAARVLFSQCFHRLEGPIMKQSLTVVVALALVACTSRALAEDNLETAKQLVEFWRPLEGSWEVTIEVEGVSKLRSGEYRVDCHTTATGSPNSPPTPRFSPTARSRLVSCDQAAWTLPGFPATRSPGS